MIEFDPGSLACLAALVDHGSFDAAAQSLSITQSAVSQRLRSLEAQAGQRLVVRSRPLRLTESGLIVLRYARQMQALRADVARELGGSPRRFEHLPIAVNADSLATWVLPALSPLTQRGHREGYGLEILVDDQDFTHDGLREGKVLGCVSTECRALKGCEARLIGNMAYIAVASANFHGEHLRHGLTASSVFDLPFVTFNRKDGMPAQWIAQAFGVSAPRLREHYVPSSEAYVVAVEQGWGIGVVPEIQVRQALDQGRLQAVLPEVRLNVALYWHQWHLGADDAHRSVRAGLLDRVGQALAEGAQRDLA